MEIISSAEISSREISFTNQSAKNRKNKLHFFPRNFWEKKIRENKFSRKLIPLKYIEYCSSLILSHHCLYTALEYKSH